MRRCNYVHKINKFKCSSQLFQQKSNKEMEEKFNSDENSDSGYAPSPSSGAESPTFTTGFSFVSLDSFSYYRTNSEISDENNYSSSSEAPSPCWPVKKQSSPNLSRLGMRPQREVIDDQVDTEELELEMMKERFSKLLLGEDMSGSGKGVSTAVSTSNAITNLYASIFGHHQRLEPLQHEKKIMWEREMKCLLSVCDYILEFEPTMQHTQDGTVREVMGSRQRSDIYLNLPALRKLDAMLLDILESFQETEFWYAEKGSMSGNSTHSGSIRRQVAVRTEEKWWLPVPCVPFDGLSDKSKKHLKRKRGGANQIYKAAMAINSVMLADMEIPESYMASLPKSGKASIGDSIYRYMSTAEKFSPDHLLNCLNFSTEHEALELADKVEASMYTWRRKFGMTQSKSSWDLMKDLVSEVDRSDKNHVMAERAEVLLLCLKQRYPELSQTSLDTCKIQYNMDVGKAILESYSRVLEGLAFNIVAWIDDVLFVDKNTKTLEN